MFYSFAITVPKSTTEASPVTQEMILAPGVIHRVEIQFPIGCAELAHAKIEYLESPLFPTNPDGNFASDGFIIAWDEHHELEKGLYMLKAKLWNDDDTYQHTITIRIGVLPKAILEPFAGLGSMFRKFFKMIGLGK